jgi:formamidopyrimidine-DNA glycosylase
VPELPEVETIKEDLRNIIKNKRIKKVEVKLAKAIKNVSGKRFVQKLKGDTFEFLSRRGKYLIFSLKSGKSLIIHLGMTGRLIYSKTNEGISDYNQKFSRVIFTLINKGILRFVDMRGFGGLYLIPEGGLEGFARLTALGPEPLSRNFTPLAFRDLLKRHRARIKPLLLNQHFLAGLGNIYCIESLYRAKISPLRRANTLTEKETKRLHSAIQRVLIRAIASHGSSINAYVDIKGRKGSFQFKLKVYRKEGEKCPRCGGRIRRVKQNNRSTYFCPTCQR